MASQEIDHAERQVDEIESLCMNCHKDGTTRLLLTRIPFFREIVIMSFYCPECHFKNTEIQSAGEIQQKGVKYTFKADAKQDLQRQLVKGDNCIVRFEETDLEIPPGRGQLTNLEGLLSMVHADLSANQEARRHADPEAAAKVEEVINNLSQMVDGTKLPFTVSIDDPSGNSSLEPSPSDKHGKYLRSDYPRSESQNEALGLAPGQSESQEGPIPAPDTSIRPEYKANQMYPALPPGQTAPTNIESLDQEIVEKQVYSFPSQCPGCTKPCTTNMQMVVIPHFDEVVIMATVCDHCGYKTNEVKTGGAIPAKGRKIVLQVRNKEDLSRDILKAQHCALSCPELELNVEPGTLGGRFTTVEGLLSQVRDDLKANIFDTDEQGSAALGDSMPTTERSRWSAFFAKLDAAVSGEIPFTVILEDPLASSYVQSFTAPEPDSQMTVEEYDRTEEEEEDLGLNDIKVEGYEEDAKLEDAAEKQENGNAKDIDLEEVQREVRERLTNLEFDEGADAVEKQ